MWGVRETCEEMRERIGARGVEIFKGWREGIRDYALENQGDGALCCVVERSGRRW